MNSSNFAAPQTASTLRHLHWEEYKHTDLVQSLLITPETPEQVINSQ